MSSSGRLSAEMMMMMNNARSAGCGSIVLLAKNKYSIWKSNSEQIPYEKCDYFEII
jgi:hypothetical protein